KPALFEQPGRPEREGQSEPDDEEGPRLDLRAADPDEARVADAMERQRIREDVARALEGRADRGPDREGDGCGPRDPADRRPAREVRLNEAEVGEDPGRDAEHKAYDQRPEEARLVRPRLRHRRRSREHQQRPE